MGEGARLWLAWLTTNVLCRTAIDNVFSHRPTQRRRRTIFCKIPKWLSRSRTGGRAPDMPIDLRSDTVTQPGPGMRRAMAEAPVGEDLHHEDATANQLEVHVAELLGKEAALFVPTGTMGNLVALKAHTQPGEEVILEQQSHIYDCELAGLSAFCGLLARPLRGDVDGMLQWEDVRRA